MKTEIEKLINTYDSYEKALEKLEFKVREVCNFNARVTFCAGYRHLILNEDNANVATLDCLNGKTKKNKLSEKEHLKYCV